MKEKAQLVRPKVYPLTKLQTYLKEGCLLRRGLLAAALRNRRHYFSHGTSPPLPRRTDATEAGHERSEMSASQLSSLLPPCKAESVINTDSLFEQVIRGENSTKRRMHDFLQNEVLYHFVCALVIYEAYESHL